MSQSTPSTWQLFKQLSNDELNPLVDYICKTSTEGLTTNDKYKNHSPDHTQYISEIYDEICLFGGNTFVNLFRREGPEYVEVLRDAAAKVGVKDVKGLTVLTLEQKMIEVLLRKAMKEASGEEKEELEELLRQAGLKEKDLRAFISGTTLVGLLSAVIYRTVMVEMSVVIANAVAKQLLGHGLRVAGGAALGRLGSVVLGPVGLILAGVWTAADIAGPAYRVTIPCTLHIAMLRQQYMCKQEAETMEGAFND